MIRCTCGAALTSVEAICEICIKPRIPRALFVEDLRIKLANREEEILDWKATSESLMAENGSLRDDVERLVAENVQLRNARDALYATVRSQNSTVEAAEAEVERLKGVLGEIVGTLKGAPDDEGVKALYDFASSVLEAKP